MAQKLFSAGLQFGWQKAERFRACSHIIDVTIIGQVANLPAGPYKKNFQRKMNWWNKN
jgi:hypothetical protein